MRKIMFYYKLGNEIGRFFFDIFYETLQQLKKIILDKQNSQFIPTCVHDCHGFLSSSMISCKLYANIKYEYVIRYIICNKCKYICCSHKYLSCM